jgi:hypothetical protein
LNLDTYELGQNLVPGVYEDARRARVPHAGHPSLAFGLTGRGCNMLTGRFDIFSIASFNLGTGSRVMSFSAEFEQHCEGATPALFGRFEA